MSQGNNYLEIQCWIWVRTLLRKLFIFLWIGILHLFGKIAISLTSTLEKKLCQ
jgi:hypothetical protein